MESALPPTPGRGRSRFSKALPNAPSSPVPSRRPISPAVSTFTVKTVHSPLPPLPQPSVPAKMTIPRRPVGASAVQTNPNPNRASVISLSSIYSDSPGFRESDGVETPKDTQEGMDSEADVVTSLPPKDDQRRAGSPSTPPSNILGSPQSGFQSSPPRSEIWRRRSVRSDKSITFPELKLQKSNGSTAAPPTRAPERSLPQLPQQPSRNISGRKPVPARPAPPQPQQDPMGSKLSKLKKKISEEEYDPFKEDAVQPQSQPPPPAAHPASLNRLPTPEYRKTDRQQPLTPQVLSPISPETPPQDDDVPPNVPQRAQSRGRPLEARPIPELRESSSRPNLLKSHSRDSSETLTITSEPQVMRSPQPKKTFAARILTPEPSQSPEITSPLALPSPAGTQAINIKFPVMPGGPLTENTIVPGPALSITHFECYQSHKFMRNSKNTICPVACMICEKKDAEARWKCTWCCLRCCGTCMQVLQSVPNKDLKMCLEKIGRRAISTT